MRSNLILGGLMYLAIGVSTGYSDTFPYEATVSIPEVEVRAVYSTHENVYPTSKLRQGAPVTVVGEKQGGWLAIKPPPGSFSWVSSKYLTMEQELHGIVQQDGVEVRIGSSLTGKKPNIRQVHLNRGDKVVLFKDKPQIDDDGTTWVMIQPPATEVRFIPREAIKPTQLATAEPPMGTNSLAPPLEPKVVQNADPSWAEAERAEREGRLLDAEKSYTQLAKQTTDNDLRILCHNRIHMIHQANRRAAAGYQPSPGANHRLAPTTTGRPLTNAAVARPASQYTYARDLPPSAPQTRGPGLLARSNVPVGGQQGYLLDLGKGQPVLYVVPQSGVNLEPHVNRQVSVTGPIEYHSGYRQNVLRAAQVTPR